MHNLFVLFFFTSLFFLFYIASHLLDETHFNTQQKCKEQNGLVLESNGKLYCVRHNGTVEIR